MELLIAKQKKPPVSVSQPGELVIRVHLPINCSTYSLPVPDELLKIRQKKAPSQCKPTRGVSYQGASTN
ncbi:hypothetical protein NOS3756_30970 [Nostoc sp. NIES-3756]|nr:hypothetical protein NOS3756_30970 [Nostoc sp. NIES-3756]